MKKKLILFDFDGTVIDNSEGIYNCIKYALEKMNKPIPQPSILRRFIGPSLFDSYMTYCEQNEDNANLFIKYYRERYSRVGTTEVVLYNGIENLIIKLKEKGFIVAICSSKPYDFVIKIAKELGIYELFDSFFCPGFSSHSSSKSELILDAVKHFKVCKDEALMIGDTVYDVRSSKTAGVECLGVLYGFSENDELEKEGANMIAVEVCDIYPLVAGGAI